MKRIRWNTKCILCLVPSLLGVLLFFIIPYLRVLYYSILDNQFSKHFVGLKNYLDTINNSYFRSAFCNSMLLLLICVPFVTILALLLSLASAFFLKKFAFIRVAFILPMLLPATGVILIWQQTFSPLENVIPIYLLFIWKNIGICLILLTAAFTTIPKETLEAAKLDGAGGLILHLHITMPMIAPSIVFSILFTIVNTFKLYRDSYLYYNTDYPPKYSYTLQYFINNNFLKFDYQDIAASSILTSFIVLGLVLAGMHLQRRYAQ